MSIDIKQFHDLILVPTLNSIGMYSKEACQLIIGTGCQESQFKFLQQKEGPALGFFQCEYNTYRSVVTDTFMYDINMKHRFLAVLGFELVPEFNSLIWNMKLMCLVCRLHYHRFQTSIPIDLAGQAAYYKKYYNTILGDATTGQYIENFNKYAGHIW